MSVEDRNHNKTSITGGGYATTYTDDIGRPALSLLAYMGDGLVMRTRFQHSTQLEFPNFLSRTPCNGLLSALPERTAMRNESRRMICAVPRA